MQVVKGNMVRDEYPAPKGEKEEEGMDQEIIQSQENNGDDNDEQMECVEGEYSNDIDRCLEDDVYSADIGIKVLEDKLDHLQTALDHLERKNDDIYAELIDLLQSNREARKQFQESLQQCKSEEQQSK